jgi:CDGSH-type Zn-finger protein
MTKVFLEKGKNYYWCTCGLSSKNPLCDGSHKGTDYKPLPFQLESDQEVGLCGCKKTKNPPYCDGSHNN